MKFGQLIEDNMRNIFVERSYTKSSGETIPRPFSKKSKLSLSLDFKILYSLFTLYAILRAIEISWNQVADHLFLSYKTLSSKTKKRSGTSLPASLFSAWILK